MKRCLELTKPRVGFDLAQLKVQQEPGHPLMVSSSLSRHAQVNVGLQG